MTEQKKQAKLSQQLSKRERRDLERQAVDVHKTIEKKGGVRANVTKKTNLSRAQSEAAQRRVARQKAAKEQGGDKT